MPRVDTIRALADALEVNSSLDSRIPFRKVSRAIMGKGHITGRVVLAILIIAHLSVHRALLFDGVAQVLRDEIIFTSRTHPKDTFVSIDIVF